MRYVSPEVKREAEQRQAKANASLLRGCVGLSIAFVIIFALAGFFLNAWIERNASKSPSALSVNPSLSPQELKEVQADDNESRTWIDHNGTKHKEIDFRSRWANQLSDDTTKEDIINANNIRKDWPKDAPIRKQELGMTDEQKLNYEHEKRSEDPNQYMRDTGILRQSKNFRTSIYCQCVTANQVEGRGDGGFSG